MTKTDIVITFIAVMVGSALGSTTTDLLGWSTCPCELCESWEEMQEERDL